MAAVAISGGNGRIRIFLAAILWSVSIRIQWRTHGRMVLRFWPWLRRGWSPVFFLCL